MNVVMSLSLGISALSLWFTIACYISSFISYLFTGSVSPHLKRLSRKSLTFTVLCVLIFVTSAIVEKL